MPSGSPTQKFIACCILASTQNRATSIVTNKPKIGIGARSINQCAQTVSRINAQTNQNGDHS
ncbi:hypothetical protein D3C78_1899540 [compost metagenome]